VINTEIRISGFKELDEAFKTLPTAVSRRTLRAAIKKALLPVASDASRNAPRDKGVLGENIKYGTKLARGQQGDSTVRKGYASGFVGTIRKSAHGLFKEFGTSKDSAEPFMRPAWDSGKAKVLQVISDESWKSLQKMAIRLYKQAKAGKLSRLVKGVCSGDRIYTMDLCAGRYNRCGSDKCQDVSA